MMEKLILRIAKYYWTYISPFSARKRRPNSVEKQILITRFDCLGDFFLLLPFFQNLLTNNYKIVCIGTPSNKMVIDHLKFPITFIPFADTTFQDIKSIISTVRSMNFDYAFNLSMSIWGGIIVNQSNSNFKIGLLQEREHYVYKGAHFFYDKILSYHPSTHSFQVLQNAFTEIMNFSSVKPTIDVIKKNNNAIVIHPYANWLPRQWPYFQLLIKELIDKNYAVRIIGTSDEHDKNSWIQYIRQLPGVSIIYLESISHVMTEIENAFAFIGNDSGPAHYAALIGKPTTVIWGPGYFERIHPLGEKVHICIIPAKCRPCRQRGACCENGTNICLQNISPANVLEYFEKSIQ